MCIVPGIDQSSFFCIWMWSIFCTLVSFLFFLLFIHFRRKSICAGLRAEYLHKRFGILLHDRFVFSLPFIYSFITICMDSWIFILHLSFNPILHYLFCHSVHSSIRHFAWLFQHFGMQLWTESLKSHTEALTCNVKIPGNGVCGR